MQLLLQAGVALAQVCAQYLGEQGVQPVPGRGVDLFQEGVVAGQPGECPGGVVAAGQGVGEVGVDPVGDADAQQQVLGVRRLRVEHLSEQVVGDRGAVGRELADEGLRVGAALHREGAQPHPGGPSLGPPHQQPDACLGDVQPVLAQQGLGVRVGEPEVGVPDLGDLAGRPVAVQREQGVRPAGEYDAQPSGGVPEHEVQALGHGGRLGRVELVEHEDHGLRGLCQARRQAHQERLGHSFGPGRSADGGGQLHAAPVQGLQDVRPEDAGGVVGLDGQPQGGPWCAPAGRRPVGGEHRLAGAGRTVDQGERAPYPGRQASEQLGPVDEGLRHGRCGESGREHGVALWSGHSLHSNRHRS